ncbi:FecR domain-containing protein [Aureitalea sp. L0-47]|uniref:FecR family protein n=1 Tax=Aureitalea sp. L0-47 TaxID=2816962 RepID=UPI002238E6FD|nr:FecR domain-containing protein [Aureitalea sp. L0-47]MCW5520946.1 FecR domain-containing protein [Aureitalea sp. L0-47]
MEKDYLLHKYLNGDASAEDIVVLRSDPEYAEYTRIAESTSEFEPPEFKAESNFEAIQKEKLKRIGTSNRSSYKRILQIAAMVVLVVVSYVFINSVDTSVRTGVAQKESFTLPDNSEVQLNASSEIRYKKRSWDKNRSLALDGEAYFKVTKGNTFSVETSQGTVKVLGTQFNVFSRESNFSINCYEGLVSVAFNDTLIKLPAGNKLQVQNNKIVVHTAISNSAPSWIANESSFENATLSEVINELEQQYPINITSPENIANKRFTGSFTHDNLELALRSICDPLRLGYTVGGDEVTLYVK